MRCFSGSAAWRCRCSWRTATATKSERSRISIANPEPVSRSRSNRSLTARVGATRSPALVWWGQGWTGPLGPRSRRRDCMIWKVVVRVKASMSAAASTPVYLAMTGAAARSVTASRWAFDPGPGVLARVHVVGHRVDRGERLLGAGLDVGDVGLVDRDVVAGGQPAQVAGDEVGPGVGQRDGRGADVPDDVLGQVEVVDGHPAGVDHVDEHQRVVAGEVDVDVVRLWLAPCQASSTRSPPTCRV